MADVGTSLQLLIKWLFVAICVPVVIVVISASSALVWLYRREVALWKRS